jgi:hypothetical protein
MYRFYSKLLCLFKPEKVTKNNTLSYNVTCQFSIYYKSVMFYITGPKCPCYITSDKDKTSEIFCQVKYLRVRRSGPSKLELLYSGRLRPYWLTIGNIYKDKHSSPFINYDRKRLQKLIQVCP